MKATNNTCKTIRSIFTFFLIVFSFIQSYCQIHISSNVSNEITVNGDNGFFDLYITNNYNSTQENLSIDFSLPEGISYVTNSLTSTSGHTVSEVNNSNNSFELSSIEANETAVIHFQIKATCTAINYQLDGLIFRNDVTLTNNENTFSHTTSPYNILYAALSITAITPKNTSIVFY